MAGRRAQRRARALDRSFFWNVWKMLGLGGFLTSTEFLSQIASIISAVLTFLVGDLIANLFAGL